MSSVPQWNADIVTPEVEASAEIQANGGLEKDQDGALGVKVDGTTVTINSDGALQANGGGSSYTFTDGLVESSGVVGIDAYAITAGSAGTFVTDEGQIGVNIDESTIVIDGETEKLSVANPLPSCDASDSGKVLSVDSSGSAEWANAPAELPAKSASDAGKVLKVNSSGNGVEWASDASGSSYSFSAPLYEDSGDVTLKIGTAGLVIAPDPDTGSDVLMVAIDENTIVSNDGTLEVANPLPAASASDAGKALVVNSAGTGVEWSSVGGGGEEYVDIPWRSWSTTTTTWQTIEDYMTAHNGVAPLGFCAIENKIYYPIFYYATGKRIIYRNITPNGADPNKNDDSVKELSQSSGWSNFSETTVPKVPAATPSDAGKVLTVNSAGNGVVWDNAPAELPSKSASDAGKALVVNSAGNGVEWASVGGGSSYTFTDGISEVGGTVSLSAHDAASVLVDGGTAGLTTNSEGSLAVAVDDTTIELELDQYDQAHLHVKNPLPACDASDAGKVLSVDSSGSAGWEASKSLAAGSGISITETSGVVTIAASDELPAKSASDAGKVLTVNSAGTGVEWSSVGGGGSCKVEIIDLPSADTQDQTTVTNLYNSISAALSAGKTVIGKIHVSAMANSSTDYYLDLSVVMDYDDSGTANTTYYFRSSLGESYLGSINVYHVSVSYKPSTSYYGVALFFHQVSGSEYTWTPQDLN